MSIALSNYFNSSGNIGQKKKTMKRWLEMEKKREWEVKEKLGLAGGPTAVNRDGSNGQTSRVPETPTYFPVKIYSPLQQNKALIRNSARIHLYAKWKWSLQKYERWTFDL